MYSNNLIFDLVNSSNFTLNSGAISLFYYEGNQTSTNAVGNDSYVKLLVQSDTTDGSTTFVDSGPDSRTITPSGTARHRTNEAKFGSSSMYFDESSYVAIPQSSDFDILSGSDFTVDFWVNFVTTSGNQVAISNCDYGSTASTTGWYIYFGNGNTLYLRAYNSGSTAINFDATGESFVAGQWYL